MKINIKKYNDLFKGALVIFDQGLYSLTNLVTGMILARAVTKDSYGIYVLIMSIGTTIMGIQRAIVSVPYTVSKDEFKDEDNSYLASSNLFLGIIFIISSFFVVFMNNKSSIKNDLYAFIIIYIFILSILLKDYIRSYLLSHLKINNSVILGILINLFQIFFIFILFILKVDEVLQYIGVMAIISLIITIIFGIRNVKCNINLSKVKVHFINNFMFGKWILGASIIASLTSQSYPWMLSYFIDNESVATLGICIALGGLLNPVISGVYSYMLPKITQYRSDIKKFKKSIFVATGVLAIIGVFWLVICILIGDKLMIILYSDKYSGLKIELVLAAIASIVSGATTCINAALDSLKRTDVAFGGLVVSFVVTITLGVLLAYFYGIKGALFAMIISNLVNMIYRYRGLTKVFSERTKINKKEV